MESCLREFKSLSIFAWPKLRYACNLLPGSERQGSERSERSQAEAAAPHVELQAARGEQEAGGGVEIRQLGFESLSWNLGSAHSWLINTGWGAPRSGCQPIIDLTVSRGCHNQEHQSFVRSLAKMAL